MERRRLTREFKLEAVKLIKHRWGERGAGLARFRCAWDGSAPMGESVECVLDFV
jgi:hypothetical protein